MWPAGERVLSPFFACLLLAVLGVVPVALFTGSPLKIIGAAVLIGNVVTWDPEWLQPITLLEERYATSGFLARRLSRRERRRGHARATLPTVKLAARCSSRFLVVLLVVAVMAAVSGVPVPRNHPAMALRVGHVAFYSLSYVGTFIIFAGLVLRNEVGSWNQQAQTGLRPTAVVTTTEIFGRLSRPRAKTAARLVCLVGGVALLYV